MYKTTELEKHATTAELTIHNDYYNNWSYKLMSINRESHNKAGKVRCEKFKAPYGTALAESSGLTSSVCPPEMAFSAKEIK